MTMTAMMMMMIIMMITTTATIIPVEDPPLGSCAALVLPILISDVSGEVTPE